MISLEERFAEFQQANYFSRLDKEHVLDLRIGLDEKMRKAIELRCGKFTARKVVSTNVIEVGQYKCHDYYAVRFSLVDDAMSGLFYTFCEDMLESTKLLTSSAEGYTAVTERYYQWRKMFVSSKKNLLSEPEIMGLIGEILVLKGLLAQRIGLSNALKSWSGQELTHKDFSYDDTWIEAKAIGRASQNVRISSLEQLDSEATGELVVHMLERMSMAYGGITLNKLIVDTKSMFETMEDQDLFLSKVAMQGYEYNNYYDNYVYEVSNVLRYRVGCDFPKLTHKTLPKAISKAAYELALAELTEFEVKD